MREARALIPSGVALPLPFDFKKCSTPRNRPKLSASADRRSLESGSCRRHNATPYHSNGTSLRIYPYFNLQCTTARIGTEHVLSTDSSGRRPVKQTHMLYQLVRRAGGTPGPLAVLFDRTPVEVAEEKVPTLRVAPIRAARAREPSMVAERYRRVL